MFTIENFIKEIENSVLIPKLIKEEVRKDRIIPVKDAIMLHSTELSFAHYTASKNKDKVTQALLQAIHYFKEAFVWKGFKIHYGGYDQMVRLLSLGVLCNIELEAFKKITTILQRDGVKDKLLDFIIKSKDPTWQGFSNTYIQEHPYKSIHSLLEETNNEAAIQKIKIYLDKKWYQGHSDSYWHDNHKNKNINRYHGYWAFEVAAIVKILSLNDSQLQNQQYYPYDAVHW
jgi:hypothetical protein